MRYGCATEPLGQSTAQVVDNQGKGARRPKITIEFAAS